MIAHGDVPPCDGAYDHAAWSYVNCLRLTLARRTSGIVGVAAVLAVACSTGLALAEPAPSRSSGVEPGASVALAPAGTSSDFDAVPEPAGTSSDSDDVRLDPSPKRAAALVKSFSGALPELVRLRQQAELSPELRAVEANLPVLARDVYRATELARTQIEGATRELDVVDIEFTLGRLLTRVEAPRSRVDAQVERASAAGRRIEAILVEAERSSEEAQALRARADVAAELRFVVGQAKAVRLDVQRSLARVLRVQSRLGDLEDEIGQVLDVARTEGPSLGRDLLRKGPNIVEVWSQPARGRGASASIKSVLINGFTSLQDFFRLAGYRLLVHALLGFGLLLSFGWLRTKARSSSDGSLQPDEDAVVLHPYGATFLLTVAVAPMVYSTRPASFVVLTFFLVSLTGVWLLRGINRATESWQPPVLLCMLFVDVGRLVFVDIPVVEGLLLLAQGTLGATSVAFLLRATARRPAPGPARWHGLQRLVVRFWLLTFSTGTLALAFGLVHTGTILITGATGSVFAAVLWALAHRISASALAILIATLTGRHSTRSDAGNRNVAGRSALALGGLFTFFWLRTTMRELTLWEPTTKLVRELFALSFEVGSLGVSVGSVATLALGGVLAVYGARIVRSVLEEDVLPRTKLGVGTRLATSTSAYYGLLVVGVLLAAGASGVELQKLTVIVGALSVGVGFGLQNIVQNFVAGLILIFGRPVNVEDRIQLGELTGIVTRIGFRASIVRTFDGADVIVPNADLISMQVVNWTLSDPTRRMQINVGVAYGSDVQQVMKLLLGVARENPDVITEPPPDVLFLEHGSSSLDFRLRAWTQQSMNWPNVKSDLTAGINVALRDAGIEIPFPQRDVHIRSVVPKATSPDEEVSSSQGALNRSDSER